MPYNLQHLQTLDTLSLSFNRIRSLDGFPWSSMSQLSVLSIADNRIPAEFALCENLRAFYLAGNPQRGIRTHILNNGTEAVLKYLHNRLPPDVLPPTIGKELQAAKDMTSARPNQNNEGTPHQRSTPSLLESKRPRVDASTAPFKPLEVTPANQKSESFAKQPPLAPTPAATPTPLAPAEDQVLAELNAKILKLEQQLDDFAISAAKRFALKKDLAMARSRRFATYARSDKHPSASTASTSFLCCNYEKHFRATCLKQTS
ncbi:Integrin-alpha FG-GAP repeat-containing protein 2 [Phytophthora nicotianae]|uniref:Integrin-alpha FG-GAP repeat-containing protein 2 n=1 Tax=Phytophthora nicotianae TaxID=4792 RepID=A0A0W8C049_PHYNI|nr:Integrin-alpha FG-GAP repeat-containing protein 2 [Phytophthora nicotianae]